MDENSKIVDGGAPAKTTAEDSATTNPNPNSDVATSNSNSVVDAAAAANLAVATEAGSDADSRSRNSSRTPFTNLSQVDADLALARTLQEQVILLWLTFC